MENKEIIVSDNQSNIIETQVQMITGFLANLGLPSDNIIASNQERGIINKTLPDYISKLPADLKKMQDIYRNLLLVLVLGYLTMP